MRRAKKALPHLPPVAGVSVGWSAGWIDKTDFNRTRPVNLDWTLRTDGRQLTAAMLQHPEQLIQYLRAAGYYPHPALAAP